MTTPAHSDLFAEAGKVMFGTDWQSPMARALGLNLRTVQRLAAAVHEGRPYPVNPAVMERLRGVLEAHAGECLEMRKRIAAAL